MADRERAIEAMAREVWRYVLGSMERLADVKDPPSWATEAATAAYDAALPRIRAAVLEEAAAEAFRWDTGRQASEAIRALKDTP